MCNASSVVYLLYHTETEKMTTFISMLNIYSIQRHSNLDDTSISFRGNHEKNLNKQTRLISKSAFRRTTWMNSKHQETERVKNFLSICTCGNTWKLSGREKYVTVCLFFSCFLFFSLLFDLVQSILYFWQVISKKACILQYRQYFIYTHGDFRNVSVALTMVY